MALFSDNQGPVMDMYWKAIQGGDPAQQFGAMLGLGLGKMFGGENWGMSQKRFEQNLASSYVNEFGVPKNPEEVLKFADYVKAAGGHDLAGKLTELAMKQQLDTSGKALNIPAMPQQYLDIGHGLYVSMMEDLGVDVSPDSIKKGKGEYGADYLNTMNNLNYYIRQGGNPVQFFQEEKVRRSVTGASSADRAAWAARKPK